MSQCHHGFITPRWSERSGVLYFKIKQSVSAILFCFLFLFCLCCLFVLYCVFFWGVGITAYWGEEMRWWLKEVLAAVSWATLWTADVSVLLRCKSNFSLELYLFQIKPAKLKMMVIESQFPKQPFFVVLRRNELEQDLHCICTELVPYNISFQFLLILPPASLGTSN